MSTSGNGVKPPRSGLVDMGDVLFYEQTDPLSLSSFSISDLDNYPGLFSEMVLNVTWAQLQSQEGGALDTTFIDSAITAVITYNAIHGTDVGIKLRVWGGFAAPDWAKNINGPPITITGPGTIDPSSETPQTIGRFWTPLDYTMNLFHQYDDLGKDVPDSAFTLAILQQAHNSTRLVQPGNHALNNPELTQADGFIYPQMAGYAALDPGSTPGGYQTASPANLANIQDLGNNGVSGYPDFSGAYAKRRPRRSRARSQASIPTMTCTSSG